MTTAPLYPPQDSSAFSMDVCGLLLLAEVVGATVVSDDKVVFF